MWVRPSPKVRWQLSLWTSVTESSHLCDDGATVPACVTRLRSVNGAVWEAPGYRDIVLNAGLNTITLLQSPSYSQFRSTHVPRSRLPCSTLFFWKLLISLPVTLTHPGHGSSEGTPLSFGFFVRSHCHSSGVLVCSRVHIQRAFRIYAVRE